MDNTFEAFGDICPVPQRQAPKRFLVIKFGINKYTLGGKLGEFNFTPASAQEIIDERSGREAYLMMDYDHGTLDTTASSQGNSPASGWVENLEVGDEGLYANVKNWTSKAKQYLENGEYRHTSPVIIFDTKTKEPRAIQSIAITNHPALHENVALVAANDTQKQKEGFSMDETIKEFKSTIEDLDQEVVNLQTLRVTALNDMQEYADSSQDKEIKEAVSAFCDSFITDADIDKADSKIKKEAGLMFSFSDLSKLLDLGEEAVGLNDVKAKFDAGQKELVKLQAKQNEQIAFMNAHKIKSFSDLGKRFKSIETKEKEIEDKVIQHKVDQKVEKAMNDGKLMEQNEGWGRMTALGDIKNGTDFFNETIMKNPVTAITSFNKDVEPNTNADAVLAASDTELETCKALGLSVEASRELRTKSPNK